MTELWIALYQDVNGETDEPDWYASAYATEEEARESNREFLEEEFDPDPAGPELEVPKVVRLTTSLFADAATLLAYDRSMVADFYCPKIPYLASVPDGGTWDMDAHSLRVKEQGSDPLPEGGTR